MRLSNSLSSETATVEQRFEATTVVDLMQDGRVLVPAGSVVQGVVSDVDKAGRVDRDGSLTLSFDRIRVRGREHDMRATATQVFESKGIRAEAGTAGVGAGVGGIVGGIIGGVKGAILGAAIGAGGAIAATDGKDIELAGGIDRAHPDGYAGACGWVSENGGPVTTERSDGPDVPIGAFFMYGQRDGLGSMRVFCIHASTCRWASSRAMP